MSKFCKPSVISQCNSLPMLKHRVIISVLAIPTTVTYFTMYEQLKVMIDQMRRKHSADTNSHSPSWVSLTAGGLAR